MRPLLFPAAFLLFLSLPACQPQASTPAVPASLPPIEAPAPAATGTAATLVLGTYKGTLPCADCPGIDLALTFAPDHTVQMTSFYQDRDKKPRLETGQWSLGTNHTVHIVLPGAAGSSDYRLTSPTTITALDGEQQEVTGSLAPMFVLTRH